MPIVLVLLSFIPTQACAQALTPEQKQLVTDLRSDLARISKEIGDAEKQDQRYAGGLIKSLIAVRLELLKTNAALVEQRIHTIEGGAKTTIVVNASKSDPARAAELEKEIESQKTKVTVARAEADRYSGGLVQAFAETTFVTAGNTLAMLDQQYLIAKYGLAMPVPANGGANGKATSSPLPSAVSSSSNAAEPKNTAAECLKIQTYDSSVLSTNNVYTELAWKIDVANSCATPFSVRAVFKISDKDDFELDTGSQDIYVPPNGTGNARGKMLVSPPEKARRMAKQGASLSMR
jgi:hypothetical protein